jgi:hypothetical protein
MGDGVLGQERGLDVDFGSDPFAFGVGSVGGVMAASAAAELGAEVGALDLVELVDFAPGFIAYRSGYVDFQFYDWHLGVWTSGAKAQFNLSVVDLGLEGLFHPLIPSREFDATQNLGAEALILFDR